MMMLSAAAAAVSAAAAASAASTAAGRPSLRNIRDEIGHRSFECGGPDG